MAELRDAHDGVWHAIETVADRNGYSLSGLAIALGMSSTSFNKSKRITRAGKMHWPSTEVIARICQMTGIRFADFGQLVDTASPPPGEDSRG